MANSETHSGGTYYTPNLRAFLKEIYAPETPAMTAALDRQRAAGMPEIQITALDGQLLRVLLKMVGARKVVEIGTLSGYSTQWLAGALPEGGHVWTVEYNPEHARVARENIEAAGLSSRVEIHVGAGSEVLPTLEAHGPFDVVFIDADKVSMPVYLAWAREHLRVGGLVMADNAFLFGYLADRVPEDDGYQGVIDAVKGFHRELARDFDAIAIPTPEGLAVGVKRG